MNTANVLAPASSSGGGVGASGRREASSLRQQPQPVVARAGRRRARSPRPSRSISWPTAWWCASACSRMSIVARCSPNTATVRCDSGEQAVGDQRAGVGAQRVAEQRELGEQLARCRGSRGPARAGVPGVDPAPGVRDLGVDAGQLEPVRLGRVELDRAAGRCRAPARSASIERGQFSARPRRRCVGRGQLGDQRVDRCGVIAGAATWCCSRSTSRVTAAVTFGLPSRSPPIQVPKRERTRVGGEARRRARPVRRPGRRRAPAASRRRGPRR